MEAVGQLRSDAQDLGQRLVRECAAERLVDLGERHSGRETLEDQRYGEARPADRQFAAQ